MSNSKKIAQTSIKKNYIYNTIYQVLSLITPLITAPYISRVLGSSGVGIYSYTNSIVTYLHYLQLWEQLPMGSEK